MPTAAWAVLSLVKETCSDVITSQDRKLEEHDAHKPKRGRRSAAAAASGPARTRATTRVTRQTAARNKRTRQDDKGGVSGSADGYDIFRDPPKPSPSK